MDKVKEAFDKVKQDISELHNQLLDLRIELFEIKQIINDLSTTNIIKKTEINQLSTTKETPTHQHITPTHSAIPTHFPTVPTEAGGLYYPNLEVSIGNKGVPTNKQTNTPTDQHIIQHIENKQNNEKSIESDIQKASEIIDSLDNIKQEIRDKFKALTPREMLVFSTLYELEDLHYNVDYKELSIKLRLSQSSIRDYIHRLINKGIPIKKQRINNKKILVSISPELKRIASLNTILQLRGLNP